MLQGVILLHNVTFAMNEAQHSGTAVYANSYEEAHTMEIFIISITAQMNSIYCLTALKFQIGIFTFVQVTIVHIIGTSNFPSTFTNNTRPVVVAVNSDPYLFGNIYFNENYGNNGAATCISLYQESSLYFVQGANILFGNNIAQLSGGAIYSTSSVI